MHLINDPLFKKIYSLYSTMDMVQILDPQKIKTPGKAPLFSQRKFPSCPQLIQVRLKCEGRGLLHIDFVLNKFTRCLGPVWMRLMHGGARGCIIHVGILQ